MSDELERKILRNTMYIIGRADGVHDDLVQELAEIFRNFKRRLEIQSITYFSRQRIIRIMAELEGTIRQVYLNWGESLSSETVKSVELIVNRENKTFAKDFNVEEDELYQLPVERIEKIVRRPIAGSTLETWATTFTARQTKAIRRSLINSITEGIGVDEASKRLREDGALLLNRSQSRTLARTMMMQAASDSRDELFEAYENKIKSWRYVATLDSRTCLICAPYDGRVTRLRKDLPSLLRHPNCRCQVTPWNKDLVNDDQTRAAVFHSEKKVKHRDGSTSTKFKVQNVQQVSVTRTFSEFFETWTEKQKFNYLGKKRYKLYKTGKIQLNEFATPNRIKTVKELEKMVDTE